MRLRDTSVRAGSDGDGGGGVKRGGNLKRTGLRRARTSPIPRGAGLASGGAWGRSVPLGPGKIAATGKAAKPCSAGSRHMLHGLGLLVLPVGAVLA